MNKMFLCMAFLTIAVIAFAQVPQAFKYQTLVRNTSGEVVQNQNVSLRFNIRQGSTSGTILYSETHTVQTNAYGLVNIEIGNGILVSGSMSNIDWASDIKFLQTELDVTGGSSYISMGTSELLSVPFALYAESTGDQIWSKDGSSVFYNTGNVGIGTDTPGTDLDVQGHIWQSGTGNSVFLGEDAGQDDDLSNNNNTYIGNAAGRNNVSGSNNVAIGYFAGSGNELGSNNIYIGANASSISTGSNDRLNIGNTIFANLSNQQVGIGTTSPIVDLDIRDNDGFATLNLTSNYGSSRLTLDKENAIDAAYINFSTNSTSHWALGTIDDNGLSISREWSSPDGTMYFNADGNVGINTLTPGAKLDVAGHIWQTGTGQSVFIGEGAGASDDLTDNKNTYIGCYAGGYNNSGSNNVVIGYNAAFNNYSGSNNIIIGAEASGDYYTTSNFMNLGGILYGDLENKEIGIGIKPSSTLHIYDALHSTIRLQNTSSGTGTTDGSVISHSGADNSLLILNYEEGDIRLSAGSYTTTEITIKNNGRVGIGTTNPSAGLHIKGSGFPNSFLYIESATNQDAGIRLYEGSTDKWHIFNNETANGLQIYNTVGQVVFFAKQSNGNVGIGTTNPSQRLTVYNGSTTGTYTTSGWQHSSDERLKTNISQIDNALEKVMEMEGVYFDWKDNKEKHQVGLIAQDVEKVLPEVVNRDEEGFYSVSYGGVVPVLIEAIKEQQKEIEKLKVMVRELSK